MTENGLRLMPLIGGFRAVTRVTCLATLLATLGSAVMTVLSSKVHGEFTDLSVERSSLTVVMRLVSSVLLANRLLTVVNLSIIVRRLVSLVLLVLNLVVRQVRPKRRTVTLWPWALLRA